MFTEIYFLPIYSMIKEAKSMKLCQKKAIKYFLSLFPEGVGKDFAGREMKVDCYADANSPYGWDIDHILPISIKVVNSKGNLQCTNIITNRKKADYTTWTDGNDSYQVKKVKYSEKTYKVEKLI